MLRNLCCYSRWFPQTIFDLEISLALLMAAVTVKWLYFVHIWMVRVFRVHLAHLYGLSLVTELWIRLLLFAGSGMWLLLIWASSCTVCSLRLLSIFFWVLIFWIGCAKGCRRLRSSTLCRTCCFNLDSCTTPTTNYDSSTGRISVSWLRHNVSCLFERDVCLTGPLFFGTTLITWSGACICQVVCRWARVLQIDLYSVILFVGLVFNGIRPWVRNFI